MIKYNLINNEYEVDGCEMDAINVIIPKTHLGKKVKSIGYMAFENCTSLTRITIPDSIESLDDYSFCNCASLTSISIPASVTRIGDSAFEDCTSLTNISIPASVTSIGNYSFYNCTSLTRITIPDSVTRIDNGAFEDCTSLTRISIPASIERIGCNAFRNCTSLFAKSGNYKAFNKDMRCREFQYEEGKTYNLDGPLKLCERGFHYVTSFYDIFNYYFGKLQEGFIICEVEPLGDTEKNNADSKCCTDKIKIGRRLSTQEIIQLNKKEIKKMELTTNQKKELLTKKNVVRREYITALTALASGSKEFKGLKEWQRARGAYRLYDTEYYRLARLCHILGIKYLECNNAPNGGQTGAYIKIKRHLSPGKIQLIRSLLDN